MQFHADENNTMSVTNRRYDNIYQLCNQSMMTFYCLFFLFYEN